MPADARYGSAAISLNITCLSTSSWYFSAEIRFGFVSSPVTSFQSEFGVIEYTVPP